MNLETILFYLLSLMTLFSAGKVITSRNPVHAALYLVLAFFSTAGIWMLLEAEFLALTLVLVYVGAVMVLFLFVVMMLDINFEQLRQGFWRWFPFAAVLGAILAVEMIEVLGNAQLPAATAQAAPHAANYSNTKELGRLIYTDYVYVFELAAVLLLVAMVAAIALTLRHRQGTKKQDQSEQVRVRRNDRVRLVKIAASGKVAATEIKQG